MTDKLVNALKFHMASMIGQVGTTRLGTVTSVNVNNYTARIMLQPEGVLSGWLPIAASMIGSGWGVVSPPSNGEQVVVLSQEGDAEHGIIVGRLFSDTQQPPQTYTDQYNQGNLSYVQPGEVGLVHKSGKFLRLIGDRVLINGDLYVNGLIHATQDILSDQNMVATDSITATTGDITASAGNITASAGNIAATVGNVSAGADIFDDHGYLNRLRDHYDVHTHPQNGFPVPQDLPL